MGRQLGPQLRPQGNLVTGVVEEPGDGLTSVGQTHPGATTGGIRQQ